MANWQQEELMSFQKTATSKLRNGNTNKKEFYGKVLNKAKFRLKKKFNFESDNYDDIVWDKIPDALEERMRRFLSL